MADEAIFYSRLCRERLGGWKEKERKNRCGYEKKANNQFQTG